MFNVQQLTDLIIKPAIAEIQLYSEDAIELLLFTCANESDGGTYLHQIGGPALGIYQMEPATYNDIWENWIKNNKSLCLQLLHLFDAPVMPPEDRLVYDIRFATAMARIHYARVPEPLPKANDIPGIWAYYKTHYNTSAGKASYYEAMTAYQRFKFI